jgi:hypothetical protein
MKSVVDILSCAALLLGVALLVSIVPVFVASREPSFVAGLFTSGLSLIGLALIGEKWVTRKKWAK